MVPNALAPVFVSATIGVASAILTESGLSFLGFGVPPPYATWGNILSDGKGFVAVGISLSIGIVLGGAVRFLWARQIGVDHRRYADHAIHRRDDVLSDVFSYSDSRCASSAKHLYHHDHKNRIVFPPIGLLAACISWGQTNWDEMCLHECFKVRLSRCRLGLSL